MIFNEKTSKYCLFSGIIAVWGAKRAILER
jgi:hypothetical protein